MKEMICANNAPAAIGPYSQAVKTEMMIFTSGQLPIDPQNGAMPEGIELQTRQSLLNIKAILETAGATMAQIVKTTVFLSDMNNFTKMNQVYNTFFSKGQYPARSAVEVAGLPKDAMVEIEAIACMR
jgi:2-iminobutanoate/2-iminopropanoate deaminase